jgi:hypothetical protein
LKAIAGGFVSFWFSIMVGTVSAFAM